MKRIPWKRAALVLLAGLLLLSFTACGMEQELAELGAAALEAALSESTTAAPVRTTTATELPSSSTGQRTTAVSTAAAAKTTAAVTTTAKTTAAAATTAAVTTAQATTEATTAAATATTAAATAAATTAPAPAEDEYYYDLENVVRYLQEYGHLPDNFITKKAARDQGWIGGSVQKYVKGAAIGGDRFGNSEGLLPKAKGRVWIECDIDTNGARSRGAKRLLFSNDGLYYYTDDHYESFREVVISETGEVRFR